MTFGDVLKYIIMACAAIDLIVSLYYTIIGDDVLATKHKVDAIASIAILTFVGVNQ
jgi:hypothetical protein